MKIAVAMAGLVTVLALSSVAEAHFELQQPADALKTNASGDPNGGSQKSSPCGRGTDPSGVVKKVKAGGKLHLKLSEAVPHGGHYRVAVSANKADFVDPKTVVVDGDCKSATIEPAPTGVIVADGLFPHAPGEVESGKVWETDITMPAETCANCTLQVIQFMTPHSPGCFYYHCANIQIVDEDVPEEPTPTPPSGAEPSSSDGSTTPTQSAGGCNTSGSTTPSVAVLGLAALALVRSRRRRRSASSSV